MLLDRIWLLDSSGLASYGLDCQTMDTPPPGGFGSQAPGTSSASAHLEHLRTLLATVIAGRRRVYVSGACANGSGCATAPWTHRWEETSTPVPRLHYPQAHGGRSRHWPLNPTLEPGRTGIPRWWTEYRAIWRGTSARCCKAKGHFLRPFLVRRDQLQEELKEGALTRGGDVFHPTFTVRR